MSNASKEICKKKLYTAFTTPMFAFLYSYLTLIVNEKKLTSVHINIKISQWNRQNVKKVWKTFELSQCATCRPNGLHKGVQLYSCCYIL